MAIDKIEHRSALYYNQYRYCLSFYMRHSQVLRGLNPVAIAKYIKYRNVRFAESSWFTPIHDYEEKELIELLNRILQLDTPRKVIFYQGTVYVYSNHLEQLEDLISYGEIKQAEVSLPKDVILLKNPKWHYRTYFNELRLDSSQSKTIRNFLRNRKDAFGRSNFFDYKLDTAMFFYIMSYNFVDHDNIQDALMLNLVCPGIVRKTLPIQAK